MKRTILALSLGLVCGLGAHQGWFVTHRPRPVDDLESQWEWMREDLRLDETQVARIRALHEQSSPQLLALARRVAQMRREFAAFEKARRSSGEVDFLEFARYVDQQRALDRECVDSTRRLVAATVDVMRPEQRRQYLASLGPEFEAVAASVPKT
ncbi:MAG: hypothetical protein IAE82_03930 [Opitutaceae bacterium]|nr:hypothetical protein [Opitutaceae bacterium]